MKEKIAIIGLGCVFPDALDFTQYWQNIVEGKDSVREVPEEFWRAEDFYHPDPSVPDRSYCRVGAQAGPIEFDTKEFGVSPKVMEHTSVEQLFALVVARQALMDAGLYGTHARPFNREKTGVIVSAPAGGNAFNLCSRNAAPNIRIILVNNGIPEQAADLLVEKYLQTMNDWSEDSNPGYIPNVVAGRIANRFDLGGTSCSIDAACGSSMGAVKFAVDELQSGNCDMMLCGGANLDNSAFAYISFCKTPAISKTSTIKPFDASADGMILGDGVGMMVLKRLSDAERDGDKIYAVICGSGSSSDGRAKSIYAPSKEGQIRAFKRAYENSGVAMTSIGLLEAHGTGTTAGDACEVSAIVEAFPKANGKRNMVIGSVKSQVGHMRMAAGIAGVMKVALALYHKVLPNTIHVTEPNPVLLDSQLTVLNHSKAWIVNDKQPIRRAGVSAFGFGGTNFHVVMEEYQNEHKGPYRVGSSPIGFLFTADSKEALTAKIKALAADCTAWRNEEYRYETAGTGAFRLAFVARTVQETAQKCELALALLSKQNTDSFTQKGIAYCSKPIAGKVTVLFPGQGTQAVDMLSDVAINYPDLRDSIRKADNVLLRRNSTPVSELLYPKTLTAPEYSAVQNAIQNTANTQPVLAAVESGLYRICAKRGLTADFFLGHSFGELVALWADGVMDDETLIHMASERGALMSKADPNAAMMAVMTDKERLTAICADVQNIYIANENSPSQTVVSGHADAISKLEETLSNLGIKAVRLKVSGAFHSPYMKEASVAFRSYLDTLTLGKPTGSVIANATGQAYTEQIPELLEQQLLNPVLFQTSVRNAYEAGARIFVEVGNGKVLSNLLHDCLSGKEFASVALCPEKGNDSAEQLEFAMAQLAVLGLPVKDDPYRAPHNDDLIIKKSKTTYTVTMKDFYLPKKRQAMAEAMLPDQRLIDLIQGTQKPKTIIKEVEVVKEVVTPMPKNEITAPAANAYTTNAEVFAKFMDVQTSQMQTASEMLSKVHSDTETQSILNCLSLFQNNAMRAYELYFQNQLGSPVSAPAPSVPVCIPTPERIAPTVSSVSVATPVPTAAPVTEEVPVAASAPVSTPVPVISEVSTQPKHISVDIYTIITEAIADKTGYPTDMIDEDMELESDLGIDSIKRVEIFADVVKNLGITLTPSETEELSTLFTVDEIAAYLSAKV